MVEAYRRFGARECVPIYNALDPDHPPPRATPTRGSRPTSASWATACRTARRGWRSSSCGRRPSAPSAASCWAAAAGRTSRCRTTSSYLGHVYTRDHNAFNCTPQAVLNISRESMARYGFSPATRVFEAAGAGACLITDAWEGIEMFLEPEREVLVAATAARWRSGSGSSTRSGPAGRQSGAAADPRRAHLRPSGGAGRIRSGARNPRGRRRPVLRRPGGIALRRDPLDIVILGLSITSSWGNGHATTYRGLVRELAGRGHRVTLPGARPALVRGQPRPARAALSAAPSCTAAWRSSGTASPPPSAGPTS